MRKEFVPQDLDVGYEGHKRLCYARGGDGRVESVASVGWEVEREATESAWKQIRQTLAKTREDIALGRLSPLAFHMEKNLFTPTLLAKNLGMWCWTVRRHLKPKVFHRLSESVLRKYADYFGISIDELRSVPSELKDEKPDGE